MRGSEAPGEPDAGWLERIGAAAPRSTRENSPISREYVCGVYLPEAGSRSGIVSKRRVGRRRSSPQDARPPRAPPPLPETKLQTLLWVSIDDPTQLVCAFPRFSSLFSNLLWPVLRGQENAPEHPRRRLARWLVCRSERRRERVHFAFAGCPCSTARCRPCQDQASCGRQVSGFGL